MSQVLTTKVHVHCITIPVIEVHIKSKQKRGKAMYYMYTRMIYLCRIEGFEDSSQGAAKRLTNTLNLLETYDYTVYIV